MNAWPPEKRVALILLHEAGGSPRRIGEFFGKSADAVRIQLRKLGLRISCDCACGSKLGSREDGKCSWCRNGYLLGRLRYPWKPEWDLLLRRELTSLRDRKDYTRALRRIVAVTGVPMPTVKSHIYLLGLGIKRGPRPRLWTDEEEQALQEMAGQRTVVAIAKRLNRSVNAVQMRLHELHLSARITDGYSAKDLVELLGVGERTIHRWRQYGWLPAGTERMPDDVVERFIRLHPEEYDLRLVDQAWFKGMLFPSTFGMTRRKPTVRECGLEMAGD
jgi:hypothetical protein